jgi:peptide/nickel transport system substrate-binding protein
VRQALLPAIDQADFMAAINGPDPSLYMTGVGMFTPGTPLANGAGLEPLKGPRSVERARALLREAGYTNQPRRLIGPTDILAPSAMTQVCGGPRPAARLQRGHRADRLGHDRAASDVA